jgi:hypothetical protein
MTPLFVTPSSRASYIPPAIALIVLLCVAIAPPRPALATGSLAEWKELEALATTPETRVALAKEMIDALPKLKTPADRSALAARAFDLTAQDPDNFPYAARALEWIQRTEPHRRVWCLEQLRDMYTEAARSAPVEPSYAVSLADLLVQLVDQRSSDLDTAIEQGEIDATQAVEQMELAMREVQQAVATYRRASSLARTAARRLQTRDPNKAADLQALSASLVQQAKDLRDLQTETAKRKHTWASLLDAQQRFAKSATPDNARQLGMIYIKQFDRPELMPMTARDAMDEDTERHVALACRPIGQLSAAEASSMAKWYDKLARTAANEDRPDLLIRARVYFQQADREGDALAKIMLVRIDQDLERNSIFAGGANRRGRELTARLNFLFGPKPDAAALATATPDSIPATTPGSDAIAMVEPATPDTVTSTPDTDTLPEPTPATPTTGDNSSTTAAAGDGPASSQFGRPMVHCDQCGRRFFPGWDRATTTCPTCKSGRRNIFDFGHLD